MLLCRREDVLRDIASPLRRHARRTVALLIILERDGLLLGIRIRLWLNRRRLAVWSHSIHLIPFSGLDVLPCNIVQLLIIPLYRL